jgi:putative transposase
MHLIGNYYHIYNRGAHKVDIFKNEDDYLRFISLLFKANDEIWIRANWSSKDFWNDKRHNIVEIISYCLMPNHYHLCIRELSVNGIGNFMRKLLTAYSMYFNIKYMHSGTIFQGSYQSKLIDNDDYLRYLIQYIHLNPYSIKEPNIDRYAKFDNLNAAINYSRKYEYSSYKDYIGEIRRQNCIITRYRGPTSEPACRQAGSNLYKSFQ